MTRREREEGTSSEIAVVEVRREILNCVCVRSGLGGLGKKGEKGKKESIWCIP